MKRDVHDIYDVILKIIAMTYGTDFLNYIGVEKKIKEIQNVEFTTLNGRKLYLDFLCELEDNTLCHVEFQYPKFEKNDSDRIFKYNIMAETRYEKLTETAIVNFTSRKGKDLTLRIGKTKCFCPKNFYLGDIDFEKNFEKINIKVKSEKQLTEFEEITLMVWCLITGTEDRFKILKKIVNLLNNRKLFNKDRFEYIQAVIKLEIDNLLSEKERIREEIKMTPQALNTIQQAIYEVNQKVLSQARDEGEQKGRQEGEMQATEKIAKKLKGKLTTEEISELTELSIEEINNL